MWELCKEFTFEAAHRLPHHDGKCSRLHGHSWKFKAYIKQSNLIKSGSKQGMVMDFGDIKKYVKPILDNYLDHFYLNDSLGLENPTSEEVAKWIYLKLKNNGLSNLYAIEVKETCTSSVIYCEN